MHTISSPAIVNRGIRLNLEKEVTPSVYNKHQAYFCSGISFVLIKVYNLTESNIEINKEIIS